MASQQTDMQYDSGGGVTTGTGRLTDPTTHGTSIVNTGASDFVDISKLRTVSLHIVNGASNSYTVTAEGSVDGTNFSTIAYGTGSSAAYTQSALTVAASAKAIVFLPDADALRYIRLNASAANSNGTTVTVFGRQ